MPLTATQQELLKVASHHAANPITFESLKRLCNVRSFDQSFNALLMKGYFSHVRTTDNSNKFIRTSKAVKP